MARAPYSPAKRRPSATAFRAVVGAMLAVSLTACIVGDSPPSDEPVTDLTQVRFDGKLNVDVAKSTPSIGGLLTRDLVEGTGASAQPGSWVTVHYTGWLANGKEFDSSHPRGEPFQFILGVGQVIPGWDLGVVGMKVGGKRQLLIPSPLAYGEEGAGADIPPNSPLVFEVELLGVE
jgi:FKBP-type peptidyl-prolyl cis-trans isomerase